MIKAHHLSQSTNCLMNYPTDSLVLYSFDDRFKHDSIFDSATSSAIIIEKLIELFTERKKLALIYKEKLSYSSSIVFDPRTLSDIPDSFDLIVLSPDRGQWNVNNHKQIWLESIHERLDHDCLTCDERIETLKNQLDAVCSVQMSDLTEFMSNLHL